MRKSRYSDEQIAAALRQAEIGTPVADITRKLGISEASFYVWKKRFGTLGTPEIRELRQLRDENAKLKTVVADLTLDRAVLQDVIKSVKSSSSRPSLSVRLRQRGLSTDRRCRKCEAHTPGGLSTVMTNVRPPTG